MIDWRTSYFDLCKEIEVLEIRSEELERMRQLLHRKMFGTGPRMKLVADYSGMPQGGSQSALPERYWKQLQEIEAELIDIYDILDLKCDAKKRMEKKMGEFQGLEHQVAFKRDIERKPLYQIADELGFSYDWIRRISCKVKRVKPSA